MRGIDPPSDVRIAHPRNPNGEIVMFPRNQTLLQGAQHIYLIPYDITSYDCGNFCLVPF